MRTNPKIDQTAAKIAEALGETKRQPIYQIKLIVKVCGVEQALRWLKEVQQIEAQGGMLTSEGTERRTPGGLYFKLVRTRLIEEGQHEKMQIIYRGKKPPKPTRPPRRALSSTASRHSTSQTSKPRRRDVRRTRS